MRHVKRLHRQIFAVSVIVALGAYLGLLVPQVRLGQAQSVDPSRCKFAVTSLDKDNRCRLKVWQDDSVLSKRLSCPSGYRILKVLGKEKRTDRLICLLSKDTVSGPHSPKIAVLGDKRADIVLEGNMLSSHYDARVSLTSDYEIVIPSVEDGRLTATFYSLAGQRTRTRSFALRNARILKIDSALDVACNGMVCVSLSSQVTPERTVYVFDSAGRAVANLGRGNKPRFSPEATRIAYLDETPDAQERQVSVYDFHSRKTKQIVAWRPVRLLDVSPYFCGNYADGVSEVQWSPDGRWLLCSLFAYKAYPHLLTAVSTLSARPQRCYVPMTVLPGRWIVHQGVRTQNPR